MPGLPHIADADAFARMRPQSELWTEAIAVIRQRHRLQGSFVQSVAGSTVVFMSMQRCIKLYPPLPGFGASHRRERAALQCIHGRLPIPTPELVADGTLQRWRYLVFSRLRGRPIDAVWDGLPAATRIRLAEALGEAMGALHRLRGDALAAVTDPWPEFRRAQRDRAVAMERRKGLAAARCAEVEDFLGRLDDVPEPPPAMAVLHTEIGPGHVLVDQGRVTGLIDFGDAMVGDPEYDLAPVGMFVTRGDTAAFRALSVAYGLDAHALTDPGRPARLMRHALLHRYGTLAWYLETLAPPPNTVEGLAAHWFGVG